MSPTDFSEKGLVEKPTLAMLEQLGFEVADGYTEQLGGSVELGALGRDDQSQVFLHHRLRPKLVELNGELPKTALDAAIEELTRDRSTMDPTRANHEVWRLLRDGAKVTVTDEEGARVTETVAFVDWRTPANNHFLAVNQLWFVGPLHTRRTDIVCFVNGIPLVLLELKASHRSVEQAYRNNLRDYRDAIPQLFVPIVLALLSNGSETKVGSSFAPWERFGEWKRVDHEAEPGMVSLETAIQGLCEPARLLDTAENFVAYLERPGGLLKVLAGNHQVLGVNAAMRALSDQRTRDGRLGVFWHTQGSGKSLSMLFFTQKVLRREPGNWTFVMVTDRVELDDQLYGDFKDAGVVEGHLQADSSSHLRRLLGENHRYVFTLIHKFRPEQRGEMPVCSEREDVIVITDEAHRSQYSALALNMRGALPNAGFLGFTGTPLIRGEVERTREVFGEYVSTYNFRESIEDGATVPLFYENRIPELQIRAVARSGRVLALLGDTLHRVNRPAFWLDPDFHLVLSERGVLALDQRLFEVLFKETPALQRKIPEWVGAIHRHLPIAADGASRLAQRCETDGRLRRRVRAIAERGHLDSVTVERIRRHLCDAGLEEDDFLEGDELRLDDENPFRLVYMLNEDFFRGGLTDTDFRSDRKSPR